VQVVGHRFSATMHVLKQRGYHFEKRRSSDRQFEYRMTSRVQVIQG
jgi:hypothetical protein